MNSFLKFCVIASFPLMSSTLALIDDDEVSESKAHQQGKELVAQVVSTPGEFEHFIDQMVYVGDEELDKLAPSLPNVFDLGSFSKDLQKYYLERCMDLRWEMGIDQAFEGPLSGQTLHDFFTIDELALRVGQIYPLSTFVNHVNLTLFSPAVRRLLLREAVRRGGPKSTDPITRLLPQVEEGAKALVDDIININGLQFYRQELGYLKPLLNRGVLKADLLLIEIYKLFEAFPIHRNFRYYTHLSRIADLCFAEGQSTLIAPYGPHGDPLVFWLLDMSQMSGDMPQESLFNAIIAQHDRVAKGPSPQDATPLTVTNHEGVNVIQKYQQAYLRGKRANRFLKVFADLKFVDPSYKESLADPDYARLVGVDYKIDVNNRNRIQPEDLQWIDEWRRISREGDDAQKQAHRDIVPDYDLCTIFEKSLGYYRVKYDHPAWEEHSNRIRRSNQSYQTMARGRTMLFKAIETKDKARILKVKARLLTMQARNPFIPRTWATRLLVEAMTSSNEVLPFMEDVIGDIVGTPALYESERYLGGLGYDGEKKSQAIRWFWAHTPIRENYVGSTDLSHTLDAYSGERLERMLTLYPEAFEYRSAHEDRFSYAVRLVREHVDLDDTYNPLPFIKAHSHRLHHVNPETDKPFFFEFIKQIDRCLGGNRRDLEANGRRVLDSLLVPLLAHDPSLLQIKSPWGYTVQQYVSRMDAVFYIGHFALYANSDDLSYMRLSEPQKRLRSLLGVPPMGEIFKHLETIPQK